MPDNIVVYRNPFARDFWEGMYAGMWLPILVFAVSFVAAMAILDRVPVPRKIQYRVFDMIRLVLSIIISIAAAKYSMLLYWGLL